MPATIKIKNSSTASAVPTSSDLVQGELAVNVTDKRVFTENASGTVVELGTNPSILTLPDGSASAPTLTNDGDTNTGIFFPAADTVGITTGGTERARVDSSGNLGLGVTPSAWDSTFKSQEIGAVGNSFAGQSGASQAVLSSNAYYNGGWKYARSTLASQFALAGGQSIWYTAASGTAGNSITFTQAMTLDASGNLLVGTTSALYGAANRGVIEVNGSSTAIVALKIGNSYGGYTYHDGTVMSVANIVNGALAFATNGSERARIDSSGNFKVGETALSNRKFSVRDSSTQEIVISADSTQASGSGWYLFYGTSNSNGILQSWVRGDGTYGSRPNVYGGTSDIKLKQDIEDAGSQWDDIKAVRVRKYRFKETPDTPLQIGVVAQEIEQSSPGLVDESPDLDEDGNALGTTTKSVKYSVLYMKAIKALQEAMTRIEQLEADVAALKG